MAGFLIKRLLQAIFVVFAITLVVSFAIRLTGDPALMMFQGGGSMTEEDLMRIRASLGTDQPFIMQYLNFLKGMVTLDFGLSLIHI